LEAWEAEEAHAAVQACRRQYDWSPSWHQFLEELRSARRMQNRTIYRAELTRPGVLTKEANLQALRMIRDWYKRNHASREKHWHGGPNPCPVCGGMDPRIEQSGRDTLKKETNPNGR